MDRGESAPEWLNRASTYRLLIHDLHNRACSSGKKSVNLSLVSVQATNIPPKETVSYSKQTQTNSSGGLRDGKCANIFPQTFSGNGDPRAVDVRQLVWISTLLDFLFPFVSQQRVRKDCFSWYLLLNLRLCLHWPAISTGEAVGDFKSSYPSHCAKLFSPHSIALRSHIALLFVSDTGGAVLA